MPKKASEVETTMQVNVTHNAAHVISEGLFHTLLNVDVTQPEYVEVLIDHNGQTLWVNVNGICMFRACRIGKLTVENNNVPT